MTMYPRLAARVFGRPQLVEPYFADLVASILGPRMNMVVNVQNNIAAQDGPAPTAEAARAPMLTDAGIFVLPVVGGLAHRGDAFDAECMGMSSYTYLNNELVWALNEPKVRAILLDIDSPGGEAGGCFEFADTVKDARSVKPIHAVANARACSAAYAIGSSASRFYCTPSGEVGSIGVCWLHVDVSGALEKAGIVTTWVFAGEHKVDGNPYEKLSAAARKDAEKSIGEAYDLFVELVAARRPMSAEAIRKTKARTFGAAEAVELGLVDGSLSFQAALTALESDLNARAPGKVVNLKGEPMTTAAAPVDNTAALANAKAEGKTEGDREGYARGRQHAGAIFTSPEAKGRETLAAKFAADPSITPEAAQSFLTGSPQAAAPAAAREGLDARMERERPKVGADGGEVAPDDARREQLKAAGKAAQASRYGR